MRAYLAAAVDMRGRAGDLLLAYAKPLHVRQVGAECFVDSGGHFAAQKTYLLKILGLLDHRGEDLNVILQIQIVL